MTESKGVSKALILWVFPSSRPSGTMPLSSPNVHWPKRAFPFFAKRDVPHPLSIAAWATASETGISLTRFFNSGKSTDFNR